jgi:hypothetical protein
MEKELQEALSKVMFMTFEELGFVFPEAEMTLDQANAEPEIAVETDFFGPFEGKVILQICGGLVEVISTNMLGSDAPPVLNLQQDAMRELANVVCGNLLPLIAGSKEVFHLKPPRILELNGFSLDGRIAEAHVGIDQGRADAYLFVDKPENLLKHKNT